MEALHQEINNYNNNIQRAAPPRWLTKNEARDRRLHSSVLLYFKTKQEEDGVIKKGLLIGAVQTRCAAYRDTQPNSQYNACQGFGHHSTVCRKTIRCQLCAGEHNTRHHVCPTCQTTESPAPTLHSNVPIAKVHTKPTPPPARLSLISTKHPKTTKLPPTQRPTLPSKS